MVVDLPRKPKSRDDQSKNPTIHHSEASVAVSQKLLLRLARIIDCTPRRSPYPPPPILLEQELAAVLESRMYNHTLGWKLERRVSDFA
jgi:hypothetical protein